MIASFAERRAEIARQLAAAAAKAGGKPIEDDALLDEVTALVERPNVLIGQFEEEFLDVPQECLILTMKANQKYFPLLDAAGKLTNKFLVVSNISPADPSAVIGGNERVVRPRLADAKFFFDQDRKKTLESRVLGLAKVVYHNKLGTQGERVQRVCAIARAIGQQLGGEALALQAEQAALLAKADLLTDMVGEFPELQGIMGRYYALHDGLAADIADAIEDHYKPRFAGDSLPRGQVGIGRRAGRQAGNAGRHVRHRPDPDRRQGPVRVAPPCAGRHPHAERRQPEFAAQRAVDRSCQRVCRGQRLQAGRSGARRLHLRPPRRQPARAGLHGAGSRCRGQSQRPQRLGDIPKRLAAVRAFSALPEAAALAAANKRVGNILKKVEDSVDAWVDTALLKEAAEVALHAALVNVMPQADAAFVTGDYTDSLQALAALRAPVDAFFDDVMVNAEDPALRANRLGLLAMLHAAMNQVADLSKLSA